MKIKISDSAQLELDDIIGYYDQKENGLGKKFLDEVDKSLQIIIKWPDTWKLIGRRTRRFLMRRFPYVILYAVIEDSLIITCIAHQKRNPKYFNEKTF